MYSVILEPNFDEAYSFLIERISREFLVIFANCKIHYNGRANSIADFADRIILIKTDNTVIIHEGTKREPVNWQPAGCKITLKSSFKYLEMIIERKRPKEILEIYLNKIYYIASSILNSGKFELFGSEKEMIDYVYRNPWIIEEGFKPIQREVRTPYG
ncbi:MAG: endonuclease NucS, partial [Sulfolobaceae archaeon]